MWEPRQRVCSTLQVGTLNVEGLHRRAGLVGDMLQRVNIIMEEAGVSVMILTETKMRKADSL